MHGPDNGPLLSNPGFMISDEVVLVSYIDQHCSCCPPTLVGRLHRVAVDDKLQLRSNRDVSGGDTS